VHSSSTFHLLLFSKQGVEGGLGSVNTYIPSLCLTDGGRSKVTVDLTDAVSSTGNEVSSKGIPEVF